LRGETLRLSRDGRKNSPLMAEIAWRQKYTVTFAKTERHRQTYRSRRKTIKKKKKKNPKPSPVLQRRNLWKTHGKVRVETGGRQRRGVLMYPGLIQGRTRGRKLCLLGTLQ